MVEVDSAEIAERLFTDVPHEVIGKTTEKKTIVARRGEQVVLEQPLHALRAAWKSELMEAIAS